MVTPLSLCLTLILTALQTMTGLRDSILTEHLFQQTVVDTGQCSLIANKMSEISLDCGTGITAV